MEGGKWEEEEYVEGRGFYEEFRKGKKDSGGIGIEKRTEQSRIREYKGRRGNKKR